MYSGGKYTCVSSIWQFALCSAFSLVLQEQAIEDLCLNNHLVSIFVHAPSLSQTVNGSNLALASTVSRSCVRCIYGTKGKSFT